MEKPEIKNVLIDLANSSCLNHNMELIPSKPPLLPILPLEILDIVLEQAADDPVFLWAVCRHVSSSFQEQVEIIFKWFPNGALHLWGFEGHFSRLVDDSAYFKINIHQWNLSTPITQAEFLMS